MGRCDAVKNAGGSRASSLSQGKRGFERGMDGKCASIVNSVYIGDPGADKERYNHHMHIIRCVDAAA